MIWCDCLTAILPVLDFMGEIGLIFEDDGDWIGDDGDWGRATDIATVMPNGMHLLKGVWK